METLDSIQALNLSNIGSVLPANSWHCWHMFGYAALWQQPPCGCPVVNKYKRVRHLTTYSYKHQKRNSFFLLFLRLLSSLTKNCSKHSRYSTNLGVTQASRSTKKASSAVIKSGALRIGKKLITQPVHNIRNYHFQFLSTSKSTS